MEQHISNEQNYIRIALHFVVCRTLLSIMQTIWSYHVCKLTVPKFNQFQTVTQELDKSIILSATSNE